MGAGDATGGAVARRFARGGYVTCVTRRSADKLEPLLAQIRAEGGTAHGFASDARREEAVQALVDQIERDTSSHATPGPTRPSCAPGLRTGNAGGLHDSTHHG